MKKVAIALCFLLVGCSYSPRYQVVKDSYNTYAPVNAPSYTSTYVPVYSPAQTTYAAMQPQKVKKAKKVKKYKVIPNGGSY
jgi:hypothetical protein